MVMRSGTTAGGVRPNAKENGHITLLNGGLGAWNGAGGRHGAPLLRKSRKSANIHTKSGFHLGNPGLMGLAPPG
jgi:hypothetical protein